MDRRGPARARCPEGLATLGLVNCPRPESPAHRLASKMGGLMVSPSPSLSKGTAFQKLLLTHIRQRLIGTSRKQLAWPCRNYLPSETATRFEVLTYKISLSRNFRFGGSETFESTQDATMSRTLTEVGRWLLLLRVRISDFGPKFFDPQASLWLCWSTALLVGGRV